MKTLAASKHRPAGPTRPRQAAQHPAEPAGPPASVAAQLGHAASVGHRFARAAVYPQPEPAGQAETPAAPGAGLPQPLKTGVERLSGLSLDGVQVHYNSSRPAEFGAAAYTQGNTIHVGPGQEEFLPHEAWHTVQQRQGRVRANRQLNGQGLNDSAALEHEAEVMGQRATARPAAGHDAAASAQPAAPAMPDAQAATAGPVQMIRFKDLFPGKGLKASDKHIKGAPAVEPKKRGGKRGRKAKPAKPAQPTTKASRAVMAHAQAQIEGGVAQSVGEANAGNDYVFEVARQHRHRPQSPQTRMFNVHKGGGDGKTVGFYMQEGQLSESESSEDDE